MAQGMQTRDKKVDELEKQVGQIAEFMGQFRDQGRLPSSTVANPKGGFETAKAITLRTGKQVGTEPQASKTSHEEDEKLQFEENTQAKPTARREPPLPQPSCTSNPYNSAKVSSIPNSPSSIPLNVPFPGRLKQSKKEENEKDILETFRKVQVNIPLLDAIKQVPRYAKFFKELCTTRRRISNKEVVQVSENVSAVLQRKLPPKDYLDMLEDDPLETTIAQGLGMKPNLAVPKEEHAELVAALESLPQHRALKYLLTKKEAKPRLIRWIASPPRVRYRNPRQEKEVRTLWLITLSRLVHEEEVVADPRDIPGRAIDVH
nr:uncharacterized protein LOC114826795 [Malus domestica]